MIIQEFVEMKIHPGNYTYWKNKGYDCKLIKNNLQTIQVNVSDLKPGSNMIVQCKCDICNEKFENKYCSNTNICKNCKKKKWYNGEKENITVKYDIPSKKELVILHHDKKYTLQKLAKHYSCSIPTVKKWLKKRDIEYIKFHTKKCKKPSQKKLEKLYFDQDYNIKQLCEEFKVTFTTIDEWFKEYNIEKKINHKKCDLNLSRKKLYDLNYIQKLSIAEIAEKYNVSTSVICRYFREHEIEPKKIIHNKILENSFIEDIKKLNHDEKMNLNKISKIYNVHSSTIKKFLEKNNVNIYFHTIKYGKAESKVKEFLNSYNCNFQTRKNVISPYELDGYDSKYKLAFEYCGLYWHSEKFLGKGYSRKHYNKLKLCEKKDISLVTIFEDEWIEKCDIVKSILLHKINKTPYKIYARNCIFRKIEDKRLVKNFLQENHIQGKVNFFSLAFGLYFENELVAVITFGKHHRDSSKFVLSRLCFKKYTNIIGGSNKLFKNSLPHLPQTEIYTWSDNRWFNGNIYEKLGFIFEKELKPDYFYVKGQTRYSKQLMKKSNINCPKNLTEKEYCENLGYYRIWDCGKKLWVFNNCSII